jgi:chromosome segregation ATPase
MATAAGKAHCVTCGKEKSSYKCGGCSREFCFDHLADHKQELSKQFDEIEVNRDLFRQTLTEQTTNPPKHALIEQIDTWERDSIQKIRQTADEARQLALENTVGHIAELETKLNKLTDQLRQSRQENDFNETDLHHFQEELIRLTKALAKPSNVSIRQDSTPLIARISIDVTSASNRSNARKYVRDFHTCNVSFYSFWNIHN